MLDSRLRRKHPSERPSHDTNMQNTLGYKNILGLARGTPRLGQKGLGGSTPQKRPSYRTNILGGNDGVLTGQSMKVTMYGWFKRRVAEVAAED